MQRAWRKPHPWSCRRTTFKLNAITAIWRTVVLRNDNFCRNLDEIKKFAKDVRRNYGRVTMLINNAGIVNGNFIIDIQNSSVERLIRVNLLAPLYLVKEFLPGMLGNAYEECVNKVPKLLRPPSADDIGNKRVDDPPKGHFVFLSSVASQSVVASLADYCASKAGLSAVADTLRVELDIMGALKYISVTDIRPFVINTGLFEGFKCRLSWLFPILRPEDTVQRIVEAIRHREGVVYIPWWMWFIPLIHRVLPYPVLRLFFIISGNFHAMDNFNRANMNQD
uniref:NAD(P)-binding protein n=1 Tax=Mesocestoides corti TaxID=53468 RepID=A0A5K3FZC3_MESCO